MTFWTMNHVVTPSWRLLNAERSPFGLLHEPILWNQFGDVFGDVDVSILVFVVFVLVRIVEIIGSGCHDDVAEGMRSTRGNLKISEFINMKWDRKR